MEIDAATRKRGETVPPMLDESQRRRCLAAEAESLGRGADPSSAPEGRVRREGGGRKPIEETQPGIIETLKRLVDTDSHGDERPQVREGHQGQGQQDGLHRHRA